MKTCCQHEACPIYCTSCLVEDLLNWSKYPQQTGSLLDHIYFNGNAADASVDVIDTYYSDHDATFLSICG